MNSSHTKSIVLVPIKFPKLNHLGRAITQKDGESKRPWIDVIDMINASKSKRIMRTKYGLRNKTWI